MHLNCVGIIDEGAMMRVLYIDISLRGHRVQYLQALVKDNQGCIALLPEKNEAIACEQIMMRSGYDKIRNFVTYISWLNEIRNIVKARDIEIVHFLCGDALYKFFGIGLGTIQARIIVTYHHMQFSSLRKISIKSIFSRTDYGIVHTDHLKNELEKLLVSNVKKIEYPMFGANEIIDTEYAKKKLDLPLDRPAIVILGGTQKYKGLDILLDALKKVDKPFYLYITGVERDISLDFIINETKTYQNSVKCNMKRLTDEEYQVALSATDYIVLPYRKEFDGASGPMIEGVWNRKPIIGADHGSMGDIIRGHNLGVTFSSEDSNDLSIVLNKVLSCPLEWTKEAESFRENITIEQFLLNNKMLYKKVGER